MASSKSISIVINARDNASATLKKVDKNVNFLSKSVKLAGAVFVAEMGRRAVRSLVSLGKQSLQLAGQLESSATAFGVLLGSAEEAEKIINRIKDEAKRTPFEIQGLTDATLALTAITKDGDEAIDTILDIGEAIAASGKGQAEFDRVVMNLQEIASTGKVTTMDMRQFARAVPGFYDMLEKSTGKSLEELKANNELTFESIQKAFKDATEEGGMFFGMYEQSAQNFEQQLSNMKDNVNTFLAELAVETGFFDAAKGIMEAINNMDWEAIKSGAKEFLDIIKKIITTMKDLIEGSFKALGVSAEDAELAMKMMGGAIIAVFGSIALAITAVIIVVGALVRAIRWLSDYFADKIWKMILGVRMLKKAFTNVANAIGGAFSGAMNTMKSVIVNSINWVIDKVNSAIGGINRITSKVGIPAMGTIPRLASGADSFRGGMAVVGETGAEIVNLPRGAQVSPAMGGTTSAFNNYGTINLNTAEAVDAFIDKLNMDTQKESLGLTI